MSHSRSAIELLAAARLRADKVRRPRFVAVVAAFALLVTGGSALHLTADRPACATSKEVLGVIAGSRFDADGPLPDRATAAMRVIRQNGGYEGVWVERGGVFVGVYGPSWDRARTAATAVASVPGPRITYICEPATERQLLTTQAALGRVTPAKRSLLGSGIDVKNATVTVAVKETAPTATEADFARELGPRVKVTRVDRPSLEMSPGRGRMPQDTPH